VDVAAAVLLPEHAANGEDIGYQRHVDDSLAAIVDAAFMGLARCGRDVPTELARVRLVGDNADSAAHGACAEQGALGALQNLHARDIIGADIRSAAAAAAEVDAIDYRFVEVEADGAGAGRLDASNDKLKITVAFFGELKRRRHARQVLNRPDILAF